jgi:hypothetical protein
MNTHDLSSLDQIEQSLILFGRPITLASLSTGHCFNLMTPQLTRSGNSFPLSAQRTRLSFLPTLSVSKLFDGSITHFFSVIACSARVDAAAPTGGMVVLTAAWGMPAAVMVQVRVRT